MITTKRCKRCGKKILIDEKAVELKTFIGNKNLENLFWHWQCYLDWRDESLTIRAKKIYADTMKACIPKFKWMLKGLGINEETTNSKEGDILQFRPS
jgi:hypothetical protein